MNIPNTAIIISIFRSKENFIPHGDTVIHDGDDVLAIADEKAQTVINELFNSKKQAEFGKNLACFRIF